MTVDLTRRHPPATEEALAEAERQLEVRIPQQYRRFLLEESNGGRPEESVFWRGTWPNPGVERFLGVGREGDADLVRTYERYRDRMPSWCLPFADAGGDLLCLSLRTEDAGAVYFWFHEEEADEGEEATERNLYRITDSFDEFLAGLTPIEEVDLPKPEGKVLYKDEAFFKRLQEEGGSQ
jgi:hypothetical protein